MSTHRSAEMRHASTLTAPNALTGPAILSPGRLTVTDFCHENTGPIGSHPRLSGTRWGCDEPPLRPVIRPVPQDVTCCPSSAPTPSTLPCVVPPTPQTPRTNDPCQILTHSSKAKAIAAATAVQAETTKAAATPAAAHLPHVVACPSSPDFRNS